MITMIKLKEGLYRENNGLYTFYWKGDRDGDLISLKRDTSGISTIDGIDYIYGYEFNNDLSKEVVSDFRYNLKNYFDSSEYFNLNAVKEFVKKGILRADTHKSLQIFKVLVTIKSTSTSKDGKSLIRYMKPFLFEYTDNAEFALDIELIKNLCKDVELDTQKIWNALNNSRKYRRYSKEEKQEIIDSTLETFETAKKNNELFKMKEYLPILVRSGFSNFLKFKDENDEELYRLLEQGTEVLICEDFVTSGSTIKEVKRLLESVNPNNHLTVFALINQMRSI